MFLIVQFSLVSGNGMVLSGNKLSLEQVVTGICDKILYHQSTMSRRKWNSILYNPISFVHTKIAQVADTRPHGRQMCSYLTVWAYEIV